MILLVVGAAVLTGVALYDDNYAWIGPKLGLFNEKKWAASQEFLDAKEEAERNAERTVQIINRRETLPDGTLSAAPDTQRSAVTLLRNDPFTHGPRLFSQHCASCHTCNDPSSPTRKRKRKYSLNRAGLAWLCVTTLDQGSAHARDD